MKRIKIKYKLIGFISLVITISIIPLTILILYYNQMVITNKTLEICKNLSFNVASAATEELILNTTYDATKTVIKNLSIQEINGLERAYVLNFKGDVVTYFINPKGKLSSYEVQVKEKDFKELRSITELKYTSKKIHDVGILQFVFPIYVLYYEKNVRLGEVVFEFNEEEIYLPIRHLRDQILLFSTFAFIISILITLFVSLKIVRPIQALTDGARIFGEGKLDYRIKVQTNDEIGELAFTFNQMAESIQDFTQNLEEKVRQRTHELNESLKKVQELKTQQDGDYYLTSLLLQPFIGNHNTSSNIKTEFLIRQKKQFSFKKWQAEIGGDYCFTSTIKLGGKNFLFFINADAMGKSIQGAGGLLVLGSIINSIVIQAKHGKASTTLPEIWLKNVYQDLQQIFLSFEGTMYISCVFGLIDEECGFMYFTNIEHPFSILYRNKKAQFLEEENLLKKLGTTIERQNFSLRTFLLEPGDTIFIGSDGKDDLVYYNEENQEIINEDEYLILNIIEKNEGDLKNIFDYIFSNYKVIDDISILKIEFVKPLVKHNEMLSDEILDKITELRKDIMEQSQNLDSSKKAFLLRQVEQLEKYIEQYPYICNHLGNLYYLLQDYEKAYSHFHKFYKYFPYINDVLFAISKTLWNLERMKEAIDFAEMLYLRDPNNINYIVHLIRMYIKMKVLSRSETLLEELKKLGYEHEKIVELENEIKTSKMELSSNTDVNYMFIKGLEYYSKKNYLNAIEVFENALQYDQQNTEILIKLANSYAQIQNYERAKEYYQNILNLTPNNLHALNNLAVIYYIYKDFEKARILLEKCLKIEPSFTIAQDNLRKLQNKTMKL